MTHIEIKSLNYYYPEEGKKALDDISLKIAKGEIIFIMGESGSGKSTLAKCLAGSIPNFYGGKISGEICVSGKLLDSLTDQERSREITMVLQDPEKQLVMNKVHREVAFGLENIGLDENMIRRRTWEAMQFTNILDIAYRETTTLSGGQKQKVAIASAVAYLPGCIILDEPTSQLDPSSADEVVDLIKKINEELGITIIVVEQRVNKWFAIADKAAVLKGGRMVFSGTKEQLYESSDDYLNRFLPTNLRLMKFFKIKKMPSTMKEIRENIEGFEFESKSLSTDFTSSNAITLKNLSSRYGSFEALKEINLSIKKGEIFGIFGANGAGKSTLLKIIMGLKNYSGSSRIFDNEISRMKIKDLARIVGYVSQNPNDYISRDTVYEELKFTLDNYGIRDEEMIQKTLRILKLQQLADKNPRDISGGERQRLAIASILVLKPMVLLLDEPTRGLDLEVKNNLGSILKELNKNGTTIVVVTHDIEFASEYCSRIAVMFNGEMVALGSREEILSEGIYYTTEINKLLRYKNKHIITLNEAIKGIRSFSNEKI